MKKLRGVNLGGWLVLEKWMTPSLFAGTTAVDEYTFMLTPGARTALRDHQKNFIREEDFKWMRRNGINAVRIPVGYWIFDGDDPYVACIGRLDWAFMMAAKYDIEVLVSLHGAPGSQNGHDNSGQIGTAAWYRNKQYRQQTVEILDRLAERYRDHPKFWGIELLNEPRVGVVQWKLRQFYNQAYRRLKKILMPTTHIVFHDAFTPRMLSAAIWDSSDHPVTMDIHWYHFAFWAHQWTPLSWYWQLIAWHGRLVGGLQRWQGVVVGEWSNMLSHQALSRHPSKQHQVLLDEHLVRQLAAYRHADGWFYWTYKTEQRGDWHFRSLVEDGRVPHGWQD
ncbi:MAG TPA: cellulase family glycosylhydrolase [Candidatus Saccharimonas sp.]|nr:cellulase family glycosylhydrolase [Candidatus Saccharimonas sp.]